MNKKETLKILDLASYIALIAASILVLLYEFIGTAVLMKISVIMYGAAFLTLIVLCVMKLIFMKNETKQDDEIIVDKTTESKPWIYVRLVFAALCFAFTVVFFVMF